MIERTYPGLGIGLHISCEIAKHHGGKIWVNSNNGEGSIFQSHVTTTEGNVVR